MGEYIIYTRACTLGREIFSRVRKLLAKSNIISRLRIEVCGRFERRDFKCFSQFTVLAIC
jgi:hypothetical protein